MVSKKEEIKKRKRICDFYFINKSHDKNFTVDHFNAEQVPRRGTIYDIIERAENDSGPKRVQGSVLVAKVIKRLKTMFDHSDRVSMRQAGRKF